MIRPNPFSELLKGLRDLTDVKTQTLSDALGYDCTYISKWISGAKLPSSKSAKRNIRDIAAFFGGLPHGLRALQSALVDSGVLKGNETSDNPGTDWLYSVLLRRYERQAAVKSEENRVPACCLQKSAVLDLFTDAIGQMYARGERKIHLVATMDVFSVFGNSFFSLFNALKKPDVELHITLVSSESLLAGKPELYCRRMVGMLNLPVCPHLAVYSVPALPSHGLMVLRQELALDVILQDGMFLAAFCCTDPAAVNILYRHCAEVFNNLKPLITPAGPETLFRKDIRPGGRPPDGSFLFFSGAPSFLAPPEVLTSLCKRYANDADYGSRLESLSKLSHVPGPDANFDIMIYRSLFLKYLSDGEIEICGRRVRLTPGERAAHIAYLAGCMDRCARISVYMIDDSGSSMYRHEKGLSIFIEPRVLSVVSARNEGGTASPVYHVSSSAALPDAFRAFLTAPAKLKECTRLTAARMREYAKECSDN